MLVYALLYGLLGAVVGSFLNVCIDRLPAGGSLVKPPSHCPTCGRRLRPWELVPILSYLVLGGRCRSCGAGIPLRVLAVEILTALFFTLTWLRYGLTAQAILISLYGCLLIVMAGTDLEKQRILNVVSYPAILISLVMIPIFHIQHPWQQLLGGLVGFAVLFLIAVLAPGAMGFGDVKLVLFLGLITGFPEIILVLFTAFVVGGMVAGFLLILNKVGPKDQIAFGPFLALAGMLVLLYGDIILRWWIRRIGV